VNTPDGADDSSDSIVSVTLGGRAGTGGTIGGAPGMRG